MSLFTTPFGRERPFKSILGSSATATLVTAGSNGGTVVGLRVYEAASSTGQTVTLDLYNGTSAYGLAYQALTAHQSFQAIIETLPVVLLAGETLRITPTSSTGVHVTGVIIDPPQRT